jgi:hypothetical protein
MVLVTRLLKRTVGEDNKKTEMYVRGQQSIDFLTNHAFRFMTANRSVKTGLTASAVISVGFHDYEATELPLMFQ